MRIPSGVTDQYIYFVAVDSTDLKTRETGLTSFTVYRSRNGAAAAAMTTPTVNETDATNMPGVYELLLDEDMTIGSGNDSEEMVFHITQASMAPVTRTIELYRPKITAGNTLDVTATGAAGIDWGNIENPTTAVDLSGTDIQLVDTATTVTNGVSLAAGAITNASLAGNMEIVFETDFATNYNATRNAWATNLQDTVGTGNLTADVIAISGDTTAANNLEADYDGTGYNKSASTIGTATAVTNGVTVDTISANVITASALATDAVTEIVGGVWNAALEDYDTQGNAGWAQMLGAYSGRYGPGVYINDAAANTNTVSGTDGTEINPVSTFTAAKTIADAIGVRRYYLTATDLTLAATHEDWEFIGVGDLLTNVVNLGSQDVDRSAFINCTVEGTQGGTARIKILDGAIQDPGVGDTTLYVSAHNTGFIDRFQLSNNDNHVFDSCYSMVAGSGTPVIDANSGANCAINLRDYSGGVEFENLSATATFSVEGQGQVVFDATCNTSAVGVIRGPFSITDNTGGMSAVTIDATVNKTELAIATWSADATSYQTQGTFGQAIGDPAADTTTIYQAVVTDATGDNVAIDIAALNNISTSDVLTQVNAALDTAISELSQGIPTATPTLRTGLMLLYMALRNKLDVTTSGADELQIYNDAGTVICKKALTDSAGDYSEAEMVSGP